MAWCSWQYLASIFRPFLMHPLPLGGVVFLATTGVVFFAGGGVGFLTAGLCSTLGCFLPFFSVEVLSSVALLPFATLGAVLVGIFLI